MRKKIIYIVTSLIFFLSCGKVSALQYNQIEIDFSKIENPWGISDIHTFEVPEDVLQSKNYHINISPSNEFIFWYYNKQFYLNEETGLYECENQKINLKIYLFNSETNEFYYSSDFSYTGTKIDKKDSNIIYSTYNFLAKTNFPNWTYQYKKVKELLEKNPSYKANLEYFIQALKDAKFTFIITIDLNGKIHPIISKNNNEFKLNYNDLQYSESIIYLNNGSNILQNDNYNISDLTKEFVDSYVLDVRDNFDNLTKMTLAIPFWSAPKNGFDSNIVLYSSFSDTIDFNNIAIFIEIEDHTYVYDIFAPTTIRVPTFDKYYSFLDIAIPEGFERTILYHDKIKSAKFYFDIPDQNELFLEYHIFSKDNTNFFHPVYHFYDTETQKWEYSNDFSDSITYYSSFRSKIFDGFSVKPSIKNGYFYVDVSSGSSDIYVDIKSDYITRVELEFYNDDDIDGVTTEKKQGYTCYNIETKKINQFNLHFKIPQNFEGDYYLNYILSPYSGNKNFTPPKIFVYDGLRDQYDKLEPFSKKKNMYTQTFPLESYDFSKNNTKAYINVDLDVVDFDLKLCVKPDKYVLDYTIEKRSDKEKPKDMSDYISDAKKFLVDMGDYIKEFFMLIRLFFTKLNPIIQSAIISIFIVFIMCCVIIMARK